MIPVPCENKETFPFAETETNKRQSRLIIHRLCFCSGQPLCTVYELVVLPRGFCLVQGHLQGLYFVAPVNGVVRERNFNAMLIKGFF